MKFSFSEELKKAEGGDYLKLKEGGNVVRIVSPFLLYKSNYQGRPTKKFVGYVIDRKDGAIKPAFLAMTLVEKIESLQLSPTYGFAEVPMPYDIDITAKNAGTIDVDYNVIPQPQVALTEEEQKAISAVSVEELIMSLQAQQGGAQSENQGAT